jgi:hypothetical protein
MAELLILTVVVILPAGMVVAAAVETLSRSQKGPRA